MPNELQTKTDTEQIDQKKTDILQPGVKRVLWGGGGLLVLLLILTFALPAGRILFFTGSLLSLVTLVVIAMQSMIYSGQWKAMVDTVDRSDKMLEAMKRQEKITADALVISNRASVGVHSIEWDKQAKIIFVRIENIGLVPAEQINLMVEIIAFLNLSDVDLRLGPDKVRGFVRLPLVEQDYGSTKLFKGAMPITRHFKVEGNLLPKEISLIEAGRGNLIVHGRISYQDGFTGQLRQETQFLFYYNPEGNFWTPGAPDRLSLHYELMGAADNERGESKDEINEQENPN